MTGMGVRTVVAADLSAYFARMHPQRMDDAIAHIFASIDASRARAPRPNVRKRLSVHD